LQVHRRSELPRPLRVARLRKALGDLRWSLVLRTKLDDLVTKRAAVPLNGPGCALDARRYNTSSIQMRAHDPRGDQAGRGLARTRSARTAREAKRTRKKRDRQREGPRAARAASSGRTRRSTARPSGPPRRSVRGRGTGGRRAEIRLGAEDYADDIPLYHSRSPPESSSRAVQRGAQRSRARSARAVPKSASATLGGVYSAL